MGDYTLPEFSATKNWNGVFMWMNPLKVGTLWS